MTMKDVIKSCNCKYAKWTRCNIESTTAHIECGLKNTITDPSSCNICKERVQTVERQKNYE